MGCFSVIVVIELTRFVELLKSKLIYNTLKHMGTLCFPQLFTDLKGPAYSNARLWCRG